MTTPFVWRIQSDFLHTGFMSPWQAVCSCFFFLLLVFSSFCFPPEMLDLLIPDLKKNIYIWRKQIGNGLAVVHRTLVPYFRVYLQKRRGHWMLNKFGAIACESVCKIGTYLIGKISSAHIFSTRTLLGFQPFSALICMA